jgi:hypothetical protein
MRTSLVVIAVALVAGLACGTEEQTVLPTSQPTPTAVAVSPGVDATPPPRSAKAMFVDAANAACREYARQDAALPTPDDLEEYIPFMERFIQIGDDLQRKLRALPVPPEDAEGINGYLAGNDRQATALKEAMPPLRRAVDARDVEAADDVVGDAIDKFNDISETQDPFAKGYGLVDCANEDTDSSVDA